MLKMQDVNLDCNYFTLFLISLNLYSLMKKTKNLLMKRIWVLFLLFFLSFVLQAKTVIYKVNINQPKKLEVVSSSFYTITRDSILLGGDVHIEGGASPYHYSWINNGQIIGSSLKLEVPKPTLGNDYSLTLVVNDSNNCNCTANSIDINVIKVTAGALKALLGDRISGIKSLILAGEIDARDFKTMRDNMPLLTEIDLTGATIVAYRGEEGTSYSNFYPANSVPERALQGKTNLTTVLLPLSVTSISAYACGFCSGLSSMFLPEGLNFVGSGSFYGCGSMTSITIPSTVTAIGDSAFNGCGGLLSEVIPSSVSKIGNRTFSNCTNLSSITANPTTPVDLSSSIDVFRGVDATTCILHVPYGAMAAYRSANQWKSFRNIVESEYGFYVSNDSISFPSDVSDSTINIIANVPWIVNSNQTWLTVSPGSGSGNGIFTLSVTKNTGDIRTATIAISSGGFSNYTINVSQAAGGRMAENLPLTNFALINGTTNCFNAYDTITVAGGESTVVFRNGSTVTLIAGLSIRLLPGFSSEAGSRLDAHITNTESFCDGTTGSIISDQLNEKSLYEGELSMAKTILSNERTVKIYPNPNNGRLTIDLVNFESCTSISIYNIVGEKVYQLVTTATVKNEINLTDINKGMYFVRVTSGVEQITKKMIVK
jgi:hypothetical protein